MDRDPMMDMPPQAPSVQEQVIEKRLVACGLDPKGVSVIYRDYLQGVEVVIERGAGAASEHFECINEAIGHATILFEDGEMFSAFNDYASELVRPRLLADMERRLRERGLWDAFPDRRDFPSLGDYARALEKHAGLAPGTALRVLGASLVFDPPGLGAESADGFERYADLFAVVSYVSTRDRIGFGFIGNERVGE